MTAWKGTFRDRILNAKQLHGSPLVDQPEEMAAMVPGLLDSIAHSHCFVADNVAEYLYAGTDQEHWGIDDFPCVAPPFERFFIEWARPSKVVSEDIGVVSADEIVAAHTGWHFTVMEREDEPGWYLDGTVLYEIDHRDPWHQIVGDGIFWPGVIGRVTVEGDGSIKDMTQTMQMFVDTDKLDEKKRGIISGTVEAMGGTVWPAMLALTFINCKNVPRKRVDPPARIVKAAAKRNRSHTSYHVLDIGPMQRTLATEGRSGEVGVQRALHVCRGHFKTYTKDAPLLGRAVGTYWWGPQVRGSAAAGISEKDYRVHGGDT